MSVDSGNDSNSDGQMSVDGGNGNVRVIMVEVHSSRELKVAEEEIDVKGEIGVGVKGEGGVVVKGAVKAAAAVTMMMGKATQELMLSLPFRPTPGVLVAACDITDKSPVDFFSSLFLMTCCRW